MKKISCLFFLMLFTNIFSWDYVKGGLDWPETCQAHNYPFQAPIDISPPFTYFPESNDLYISNLSYQFHYSNKLNTDYLYYTDGNNLIVEGDFGYITVNDVNFFSNQIHIYSPSLHTISNHRYPIEIQIINEDKDQNQVSLVILMKSTKDKFNLLLSKIGFDSDSNQNLNAFEYKKIKEQIDINKYVNEDNDFFIYKGKNFIPNCEKKNLILISSNVLDCNELQIKNFPKLVKNNNRIIQRRWGREIYLTFKYDDKNKLNEVIKENKKIVSLNEKKEEMNEEINEANGEEQQIVNTDIENNNKNKNFIDFNIVSAKAVNKDILNKKVEVNLIGDDIDNNNKNLDGLFIDEDLPKTLVYQLYEEYLKLKNNYKNNNYKILFIKIENKFKKIIKNNEKEKEIFMFIENLKNNSDKILNNSNILIQQKNEKKKSKNEKLNNLKINKEKKLLDLDNNLENDIKTINEE